MINQIFTDHINTISQFIDQKGNIEASSSLIIDSIKNNGCLYICWNGGSASDAQHIAAEFTGRYLHERRSLPAVALTTDTSALTAIGNDYSFEDIFSRQLEGLGKAWDILLAISTSGNSKNVIKAVHAAHKKWMHVIGLIGWNWWSLKDLADISIVVPSKVTARVQEGHILAYHIICEIVDNAFCDE